MNEVRVTASEARNGHQKIRVEGEFLQERFSLPEEDVQASLRQGPVCLLRLLAENGQSELLEEAATRENPVSVEGASVDHDDIMAIFGNSPAMTR